MGKLLLITDVERLRGVFLQLSGEMSLNLLIANDLESGGDLAATEGPDFVFVQSHLSGFSPDILLRHLKSRVADHSPRFVLLAPPEPAGSDAYSMFHAWLDLSQANDSLLESLRHLIQPSASTAHESPVRTISADPLKEPESDDYPDTPAPPASDGKQTQTVETSPFDYGNAYPTRPPVSTGFSDVFDIAFGDAVASDKIMTTGGLESGLEGSSPGAVKMAGSRVRRSTRSTFLLWLVPVVIGVFVVTVLQLRHSAKNASVATPADNGRKPGDSRQTRQSSASKNVSGGSRLYSSARTAPSQMDTTVQNVSRPKSMPGFVPLNLPDTAYGNVNPGWERFMSRDSEFRVHRKNGFIRAIQIIARDGAVLSDSAVSEIFSQVTATPVYKIDTVEKKEGYTIERGYLAANIKITRYRNIPDGGVKALVISWE